ncbi:3-keto-disaccharide hydrolase [Sediminicola luteus]|uniref:Glycosyl hydrolase n=1 Tax=Sediminicola luteus TaxID=319238 RepID=A0A2A4G6L4_9FLAO|nr:DUF1080 domain-containing protein [Sediminicola luteus]PCE63620.1 glycosyl hydrolase [Sediminicola luteus]
MKKKGIVLMAFLAILGVQCKTEKKAEAKEEAATAETTQETSQANTDGWVSLTEPGSWRGYNMEKLPSNWKIENGVIECFGEAGDVGGDIISTEQYESFELELEWKISKAGNSGVFYHVVEDTKYHSPYQTGAEYQVLDDVGFPDPIEDWQKTGANYAMHVANDKKVLKPVGEWNSTRIIFNNGKVEHWLNGAKIVEFDKYTDDWKERRNSGKWEDFPDYGKANSGYLGLQDHGSGVWFRKVRVRRL